MAARRALEQRLRDVVLSYGYDEVVTPTFENLDLFVKKSGSDIVKQLYNFKDKGEREICLRPELTAPVMRFYFNDLRTLPKPLKIFYFGPCYRYERPQEGRYREFWQFGVELVGGDMSLGNAELVDLAASCLSGAGLDGFKVRVGHLGILKSVLVNTGLDESQRKYCMPLIDKEEYQGLEDYLAEQGLGEADISLVQNVVQYKVELDFFLSNAEGLKGMLGGNEDAVSSLEELLKIATYLKTMGTRNIFIDLGIARGLDYYTNMVFEVDLDDLGAEKQVCGGGHYCLSDLFEAKDELNATGFAIGFDRIMLGLERQDYDLETPFLDVYVIPLSKDYLDTSLGILADLRKAGLRADLDQNIRGMGKALKYAQNRNARYAVFVGLDEVAEDNVGLKDLEKREQVEIPQKEIVDRVKANR
jgi:histidyl-tRNA synthetase